MSHRTGASRSNDSTPRTSPRAGRDNEPVIPRIPRPRPPADVTPLALAGRRPPAPRPLSAAARAQLAEKAPLWDAHIDQVTAAHRPAPVFNLTRLAQAASVALDLAEYAEVA